MELETKELLDLSHTLAGEYLAGFQYPWQALDGIKELILTLGAALPPEEYDQPAPQVWVHKTAVVFPTAYLGAPCIIGPETEVRHCAFIRGSALVGAHCVVGNSVELKNVILFDNVQTPHYNYVGDSILGYMSHMGAGSITSNVKSDKTLVTVKNGAERIETGRKKFGAILGDHVEVGCNSVLNPGTVVGRGSSIYPVSCVRGAIPAGRRGGPKELSAAGDAEQDRGRGGICRALKLFVGALSPTDRRRRRPKEKRPKSWLDPERLKNRIKFVCCFYLGCWGIKSELSALLECLDALGADILAAENDDIPGVITENAGGLIFFQNDGRSIHIDLQGVFLRDIQCTAQFDGKDDTAQLIDLPDNAGRFQCDHSFLPSSCPSRQNDRCGFAVIMYDFGN